MSDVLRAVFLGIIEGLTEFLPVSSTGHMILAAPLVGVNIKAPPWQAFLYFVQIGAILAVIVYFQKPLRQALLRWPADGWRNHLVFKLAVAFLPAAVVGIVFHELLERYLEAPVPVAIALVIGAGVMEAVEWLYRGGATATIDSVTLRQALAIGMAQSVSIIPGTSRAMATIMGGLMAGLTPECSAIFSFYLAIPTIVAAGGKSLLKHRAEMNSGDAAILAAGFMTAFVVALLVVDAFMRFVRTRRLRPFAIYRVLLGVGILAAWKMGWVL